MNQNDEPSWRYRPEGGQQASNWTGARTDETDSSSEQEAISWTASEYMAHDRGAGWYAALAAAGLLAGGLLYAATKSVFSAAIAPSLALILGIFASRSPRTLEYELDGRGLRVGGKFHPYGDFKSFMLIQDSGLTSITLLPTKRFMPPLSIYFAPEDTGKVINALGNHLPLQHGQLDAVERLARRLRF